MATTLYFTSTASDMTRGRGDTTLYGSASIWDHDALSTSRGGGVTSKSGNTVDGPTNGRELNGSPSGSSEWLSPPLSADTTISGTITFNLRALESSMSANVSINAIIEVVDSQGAVGGTIVKTARTTELGTSEAAANFTATPTSTVVHKGARLRVCVFGDDVSTSMATGYTFTFYYNGTTAAASGDSYVTFNETFSFLSDPSGTVVYPTNTSSDVNPDSITSREAWTSRGGGVQTDAVSTVAGWTNPVQFQDTAGGTSVVWYTKKLQAATLGGKAIANVRAQCSATSYDAGVRVEIAVCDSDGTNPVVWAASNATDQPASSETAYTIVLAGDDMAIDAQDRLRIRFLIDDVDAVNASTSKAMSTGGTVTLYYAGSAGATGDTYITLPITISESSTVVPGSFTANSVVKKTLSFSTLTADAVIKKNSGEKTFTANAIASKPSGTKTYTSDAIVKKTTSVTTRTADAVIFKNSGEKTSVADAIILAPSGEKTFSANALIVTHTEDDFSSDSIIKKTQGWSFSSDAVTKKAQTGAFSADAVILAVVSNFHTRSFLIKGGASPTDRGYLRKAATSYANARTATPTVGSNQVIEVGQAYVNPTYAIFEGFFGFDTSAIGSGSRVTDTTLVLRLTSKQINPAENFDIHVFRRDFGTLDASDWVNAEETDKVAYTTGGLYQYAQDDYVTLTSEPALPESVSKTGVSYFAAVPTTYINNHAPTQIGYVVLENSLVIGLKFAYLDVEWETGLFADAVIWGTQSGSFTADAILFANSGTKTLSVDAVISRAATGSFTADAIIAKAQPGSVTSDAVVTKTQPGSTTVDAVLLKTITIAGVGGETPGPPAQGTLDAWISASQVTVPGSFTADSIAKKAQSGTKTADAIILKTWETSGVPTVVWEDWTLDATGTIYFGISLYNKLARRIYPGVSGTLVDIEYELSNIGSPSDSVIVALHSGTSTTPGSEIGVVETVSSASIDGSLRHVDTSYELTSGQYYWLVFSRTGSLDETNKYGISQSDSGHSGALRKYSGGSWGDVYTSDDLYYHVATSVSTSGGPTVDAVVVLTTTDTFTANAIAKKNQSGSFSANAVIKKAVSGSLTADSVIKKTQAGSSTADAILLKAQAGSFSADALISKTVGSTFTLDARIVLRDLILSDDFQRTETGIQTRYWASSQVGNIPSSYGVDSYVWAYKDAEPLYYVLFLGGITTPRDWEVLFDFWVGPMPSGDTYAYEFDGPQGFYVNVQSNQGDSLWTASTWTGTYEFEAIGETWYRLRARTVWDGDDSTAVVKVWKVGDAEPDWQSSSSTPPNVDDNYIDPGFSLVGGGVETRLDNLSIWTLGRGTFFSNFSLDAVISVAGAVTVNGDFSADAIVQRGQASQLVADAVISKQQAGSLVVDAVLRKTVSGSSSSDAVIRGTRSGSLAADAVIQGPGVGAFTASAIIKKTESGSLAVEAVARRVAQGTLSVDAVVLSPQMTSTAANAIVLRGQSGSLTSDAVFRKTQTGACTVDSVITETQSGSLSVDAVILETIPQSLTADAVLFGSATHTFTTDAVVMPIFTIDAVIMPVFTIDAWIAVPGTVYASFPSDSVIRRVMTGSLTAGAITRWSVAGAATAEAVLLRTQQGSISANAVIARQKTGSLVADAVVRKTELGSATADGLVRRERLASFVADADVRRNQVASFGAGSVNLKSQTDAFDADAIVGKLTSGSFSAEACIRSTQTGQHTIDAVVRTVHASSLTSDAIVQKTASGSFSADAWLSASRTGELGVDAVLLSGAVGVFSADAVIMPTLSADAVIRATGTDSFSADAVIMPLITADAVIRWTVPGSISVDVWIYGSGYGAFAGDAVVQRVQQGTLAVDAIHRDIQAAAFTDDAVIKRQQLHDATADAVVLRQASAGITDDAVIKRGHQGGLQGDAIVRRTTLGSFTSDASIVGATTGTFFAAAVIKSTLTSSLTSDAIASGSASSDFDVDAYIIRTVPNTFSTDAVLLAQASGIFTANAVVERAAQAAYPVDAVIKKTYSASLGSNAIIETTRTVGVSADAVFLSGLSGSFTASSVTRLTSSGSWTFDAVIVRSFTIDAYIIAVGEGLFTIDASITPNIPYHLEWTDVTRFIEWTETTRFIEWTETTRYLSWTRSEFMGTFRTGDTGPDITGYIHAEDATDDRENLNGCTVRFQMRQENDRSYRVNGLATIDDVTTGLVHYAWAINDLNLKGTYLGQWEITYPGGKVITTASREIIVERQ